MNKTDIINATAQWAEYSMTGEPTGHDWWHTDRVRKTAMHIASIEGGDLFIIEMAALLHDTGDRKLHNGIDKTREVPENWLNQFIIDATIKEHILNICENLSFKGSATDTTMSTIEGKVVQDADRLDALGAIGIARAFAYGGNKSRMIYNPDCKPRTEMNYQQYVSGNSTTINHFYEKLLLLEKIMQTNTGKQIAIQRTEFLNLFLDKFFKEWNVEL